MEEYYPGKGLEMTLVQATIFRGMGLYYHNIDKLLRKVRNKAIRADFDEEMTVKELAKKYRLSTRQIENICNQPEDQEELKQKQMSLF
jgi:Mor family transcriptional regulator